MSDQIEWKHGGVVYPIATATTNTLLQDADPALFYASGLFAHAIRTYVGPRLIAQSALEGLNPPSAVVRIINQEPLPFLLSDQIEFPLFGLYRKTEEAGSQTVAAYRDVSTWEWFYILPPMTPRQIEQLQPIYRSVAVTMRFFADQSWDPGFMSGQSLLTLAGISRMWSGGVNYGGYQNVAVQDKYWRAVVGTLFVEERDGFVPEEFNAFDGVDAEVDQADEEGRTVQVVAQISSKDPPVLASISPTSGSKAGNVAATITGTGFAAGRQYFVFVDGAVGTNAVASSTTTLTFHTPPGEAYPTQAVDVFVADDLGQTSNVLAGAFTLTTP